MQTSPDFLLKAFWLYQLFTPPLLYDVLKLLQMNDFPQVSNTFYLSDDFLHSLFLYTPVRRSHTKKKSLLQNQSFTVIKIPFR